VEVKSVLRIGSAHNNVDNGQAEAIERHQKTLRTVINEVDQLRIEIEGLQNNRARKGRGFRCVECKYSDTNRKGRVKVWKS
jgi:flavin-binding protein dodecin